MNIDEKRCLTAYLIWAFGIAWVLQIAAGICFQAGNPMAYTGLLALSMFAPLVAVVLSKFGLKRIGWKPRIKGNIRWILFAWFAPAVLGTLGAALYFLLVPKALDTELSYLYYMLGNEGIRQLENSGLSVSMYVVISCISALTFAPWLNLFFAVGEEAGWRGAMYPILKSRFGVLKGRILGGILWGIWHWPIMILSGYEYGSSYWGAPITGPLLFCLITVAMGILLDWLYDKTHCIWVPALCHGAINAFAGVPTIFLNPSYRNQLLLGPLMIGLVGGLPMLAFSAWICTREGKE